jgi:hypothetical protein
MSVLWVPMDNRYGAWVVNFTRKVASFHVCTRGSGGSWEAKERKDKDARAHLQATFAGALGNLQAEIRFKKSHKKIKSIYWTNLDRMFHDRCRRPPLV